MYWKFPRVGARGSQVTAPEAGVHSAIGLKAMLAIQAMGNRATKRAARRAMWRARPSRVRFWRYVFTKPAAVLVRAGAPDARRPGSRRSPDHVRSVDDRRPSRALAADGSHRLLLALADDLLPGLLGLLQGFLHPHAAGERGLEVVVEGAVEGRLSREVDGRTRPPDRLT